MTDRDDAALAAGIAGFYQRHAHDWDRQRSRSAIERAWLARFAALLPARPHVLDLGCGMGKPIAADLIGRGAHVTGVDTSPTLVALAAERFPAHDWHLADMRTLALPRRFDGIIAWDSLFHLDPAAQIAMFEVFDRHAKLNAALIFTSGTDHGVAVGEMFGEPLYHASLAPEQYRTLLAAHGFTIVDHVVEDPTCGRHTVWLAERR